MEKVFYNYRVDSSINVRGLNLYSFYEVSEDSKKEILCRISEMIRYLIHTKNKVYIHSVEYDNKINEIIDMFKDILNKADIKCDLYTGCINDMHKLKSFLYDNADVYNIDNKAEEYYIWLDKVIDDITINLLKIIGERLRQISSEDDKKCFSLTSISHDLKTPINIILCSNQMMKSVKSNEMNLAKYNGIIKDNCFRLLKMVDNIVDTFKEDNGELSLNTYNVDIVPILSDLSNVVSDYIKSKGINFNYICKLKSKVLSVDCEKLERMIFNLLSNAIKYTGPGGLIVLKLEEEKGNIKISVKDNGCGIPKDKQKKVFNRFYQVNKDDGFKGSGIGLSLVKTFTELMNGRIVLKSQVGKGTEFTIYLPIVIDSSNEYLSYNKYYKNYELIMNKEFSEL
jgi:two-component sensor histidine kinase